MTRIATWLAREPVRTYLYGLALGVLLLLNGYGVLTETHALLWSNLVALVLVPAVEKARSRVIPQFRDRPLTRGGSSGPHLHFETKPPE